MHNRRMTYDYARVSSNGQGAASLGIYRIEARGADDFIADTIALDPGRVIPAIKRMRASGIPR
jgi:hypothetical protein